MKYVLVSLVFLFMTSITYSDQIYQSVGPNGQATFSDKPINSNSVPIKTPTVNTAPSTSSPATTVQDAPTNTVAEPGKVDSKNKPYTLFDISSPADQETIQNQPVIPVTIQIEPKLQSGDSIQIYLDGKPWGTALPTTRFQFTAPDRGTHTLSAVLFDKNMVALKDSATHTIFVHQAHIGNAP